ncbi:MAG TPA: DUF6088 family protein, partial [Thermodesulfobacteriota bacterium]|nr:DUF6088 family protein [Thermodesulfobacteriota bacterium]
MKMIEKSTIIPIMSGRRFSSQFITDKIKRRIYRRGRGSVFTAHDFADIGGRASVDLVLARLARHGTIQRIARGLYLYPRLNSDGVMAGPSVEAIASALASAGRLRLQPSGAYAANLLGLSEQVPMRAVFLTDGSSRRVIAGSREIVLKRTTPRNMSAAGRLGGLVIQALRYVGEDRVDEQLLRRLRTAVPREKRPEVLKDSLAAPAWIRALLHKAF